MPTRITARQFEATNALRTHILQQVESLEKVYNGIHDTHVVLVEEAEDSKRADVTIQVYRQTLTAHDTAPTYEAAVSECAKHLRRQVLRYKDQLRDKGDRQVRA